MDDEPDNAALFILRSMRDDTLGMRTDLANFKNELRKDMLEVRERLGMLEGGVASVSRRLDRLSGEVDQIRRRVDLEEP